MTDPQTRLGTALVVLLVACYAVIDIRLAPAWTSDQALWDRVLQVSPSQARAMNNLGEAIVRSSVRTVKVNTIGFPESAAVTQTYQDPKVLASSLFWFASARAMAKAHPWMPQRERNTIMAVADQNLVAILVGWTQSTPLDSLYVPRPYRPRDYQILARYPGDRAALITELLEELWTLQQSGAFVAR